MLNSLDRGYTPRAAGMPEKLALAEFSLLANNAGKAHIWGKACYVYFY